VGSRLTFTAGTTQPQFPVLTEFTTSPENAIQMAIEQQDAAITNAGSQKILQTVFGSSGSAPHSASSRAAYYSFVSSLLDHIPRGYESLQSTIPGPGAG
jgi:hypothetical protein